MPLAGKRLCGGDTGGRQYAEQGADVRKTKRNDPHDRSTCLAKAGSLEFLATREPVAIVCAVLSENQMPQQVFRGHTIVLAHVPITTGDKKVSAAETTADTNGVTEAGDFVNRPA
jgi:hypothetical protein